jgi:proton-coupled amino acid transporter
MVVSCTPASELWFFRGSGLPLVFGTACFALEGIGLVLPVRAGLSQPERTFSPLLARAMLIVTTAYLLFGVMGYVFFGAAVNAVITENLGASVTARVVRVSLSLSLVLTYAIQFFPVAGRCGAVRCNANHE